MTVLAWTTLLLLAVAAWAGPTWRPRPLPGVDRDRAWTIGHRGARGVRRENTVEAFRLALQRCDGIETDVQRTRDGRLVLWHDFDCHGHAVRDASLAELRDVEPSLATVDDLVRLAHAHPGTVLNLEIKSRPEPRRAWHLERDLLRAVRDADLSDRVLVSSFDPLALARVRLCAPSVRIALLIAPELPRLLRDGALARWLHVDALHPQQDQVDADLIERSGWRELPVHVWTVNDPDRMRALVRSGASALIGDDPDTLARHGKGTDA
ncbi:MAG: glycerophosphodiester phosphodiesterase [Trueperaceae bacterium]